MQTGSPNKVFNIHTNKNLEENFLYRNYLDEAGQSQVENFLMRGLKKTFRAFMTGAVSCNDSQEIKSAIYKFCEIHNIAMDAISYEMLKKDWYRYRARHPKIFKKNGTDIVKI